MNESIRNLSREQLGAMLADFAKNWLAHDGLWFQAVERHFGLATATRLDAEAWERFTVIEALRIMKRHQIAEGSGLEGLKQALQYRLYAVLNRQEIRHETDRSFENCLVDRAKCEDDPGIDR